METENGLTWKKYEARLSELENRLAGKKPASCPETGAPAEKAQSSGKPEGLISENDRLREETIFLKAENDANMLLKEEVARLKHEHERIVREKDAEISRLYGLSQRRQEEADRLRSAAQRKSREILEEAAQAAAINERVTGYNGSSQGSPGNVNSMNDEKNETTGLVEWLSKPLITVKMGQ